MAPEKKRPLDPSAAGGGGGGGAEPKRPKVPALAGVIVEALRADSLQKLCSSLEPILRRIVSEEVERALAKLAPTLGGRSSPKRIEGPDGRNLQLNFRSRLSLPLFTGGKVEGERGAAIHVLLLDATSGHVVSSGPESSAKLDIVVLEGDFDNEGDDNWSEEDFESHIVKEREGKRPLLTGDLQVSLKEGVGTLGELTFTDNSSWIRSRKFRLGLKVASGFCEGMRIREAKTEAFTVKDHRGELYKKHYPPNLKDDVWRLEKIGKDGSFHKRLDKAGIYKVEDFLRLVVRDPQRLRTILGSGMSNKMWESLLEHAKTCVLSEKHYVYYPDDTNDIGAVFNDIYEFRGLISRGQYYPAECLSDIQKGSADALVKKAYDNWVNVIEYDGNSLLNCEKSSELTTSQIKPPLGSTNYPAFYDLQAPQHHLSAQLAIKQPSNARTITPPSGSANYQAFYDLQAPQQQPPAHLARGQPSTGTRTVVGGDASRYAMPPHQATADVQFQLESNSYHPQNQYISSSGNSYHPQNQYISSSEQAQITGTLDPSQHASLVFQPMEESQETLQPMNLVSQDDWSHQRDYGVVDDFLSEDVIRMRSHEMLESDDMQHLLRDLSTSVASTSFPVDAYSYPSYAATPSPSSSEGSHTRSSGKAVVGWLKIKAAMRWGIFVRKKAAERRAQIVELDDD